METVKLEECLYRLPPDMWKDNPALWPELKYSEVYDYFMNTSGVYTKEAMKSRKLL